jgi:hypothetical protein
MRGLAARDRGRRGYSGHGKLQAQRREGAHQPARTATLIQCLPRGPTRCNQVTRTHEAARSAPLCLRRPCPAHDPSGHPSGWGGPGGGRYPVRRGKGLYPLSAESRQSIRVRPPQMVCERIEGLTSRRALLWLRTTPPVRHGEWSPPGPALAPPQSKIYRGVPAGERGHLQTTLST